MLDQKPEKSTKQFITSLFSINYLLLITILLLCVSISVGVVRFTPDVIDDQLFAGSKGFLLIHLILISFLVLYMVIRKIIRALYYTGIFCGTFVLWLYTKSFLYSISGFILLFILAIGIKLFLQRTKYASI